MSKASDATEDPPVTRQCRIRAPQIPGAPGALLRVKSDHRAQIRAELEPSRNITALWRVPGTRPVMCRK